MCSTMENDNKLDREIEDFLQKGMANDDPEGFNRLALATFERQYARIPLYRKYCDKRCKTPENITFWDEIPALPTDVFKSTMLSVQPDRITRTFMTSGTSGRNERGKVGYDQTGLRLMDITIHQSASTCLFPDRARTRLLIIAPSPQVMPGMIMAYGMSKLLQYFGLPESRFFIDEKGFDQNGLIEELIQCQNQCIPATILGGSSGLLNFLDFCHEQGISFQLPYGSRLMDAGGFKGLTRQLKRREFINYCHRILGIEQACCVNLLGMTELASQFYDNALLNWYLGETGPLLKINPPWTRTLAVHPDSLETLPHGQTGLLKHFDLANRGHICALQTDDLGYTQKEGFQIIGRAGKDQAKGCALTVAEMTSIINNQ